MYGLIGYPLSHSFSAEFFNKKFKDEEINDMYQLFPLEKIEDVKQIILDNTDLKGLNVTIPYKEKIIPFLDSVSEEVSRIGAVNVIKVTDYNHKKILKGYNTDTIGFRDSLIPYLRPEIKNALILGTGGASKAVDYVLNKLGIETLKVSRSSKQGAVKYDDLNEKIIADNLLIVNTTPLGMYPETLACPPIPYEYLSNKHVCFDLIYNPDKTEFLKRAEQKGAIIKNGLEMLYRQALAAWDIWQTED